MNEEIRDEMNLRDYFAAKAMQSIMNTHANIGMITSYQERPIFQKNMAENSYEIADAMLKAREEK